MRRDELRGRRILVVEDEMMIAIMLESALTDAGCAVVGPFAGLPEAEAAIAAAAIDAAVLDIDVRGATTFGIARMLMRRSVPIVMVSGYQLDILPADLAVGFFHEKPFQSSAIIRSLRSLLCGQHTALRHPA